MATATAFGQITIVDLTDIGDFSVYPMSNLPVTVMYDPDTQRFDPAWNETNLTLTPVLYYGGESLSANDNGVTIEWQKMQGLSMVSMDSDEVQENGVLTVSGNKLSKDISIITYKVNATYVEPLTQTTLRAQGQITFSLMRLAGEARDISIKGGNTFKYNENNICTPTSISLKAEVTDTLEIDGWYYSVDNGSNWMTLNNKTNTLTVIESSPIFNNLNGNQYENVLIKVVGKANDGKTYEDITQLIKLRDGVSAGNSIVLSNESQQIPCGSDKQPTNGAFLLANTSIRIYESSQEVTSQYTITATPNGVLGAWTNSVDPSDIPTGTSEEQNRNGKTYYWVTGWNPDNTTDTGEVIFTATKGTETLTRKMSLVKISTGADGVSPTIYSIDLSDLVVNKSYDYSSDPVGTNYSPTEIVVNARKQQGEVISAFTDGYIKVFTVSSTNPSNTTLVQQGSVNSSGTFTLTGIGNSGKIPNRYLRFELYRGGQNGDLIDVQKVIVTSDGIKGAQGDKGDDGDDGENAINLRLGDYSTIIPVTTSYYPTSKRTIEIPFSVFEGLSMINAEITKADATITFFGSTTIEPKTIIPATDTAEGSIVYEIPTTALIGDGTHTSGVKSLTFKYTTNGGRIGYLTASYSWALSVAATNGQNAIGLQVYTPNGYVFNNGEGNLSAVARLMNGINEQVEGVNYKWYKFNPESTEQDKYDPINIGANGYNGIDTKELSVNGVKVDSFASFKCVATYNNNPYVGYVSMIDKTDPIQVDIISTIGNQIVNGQGIGAFYAKTIRNGVEIDKINESASFVTEMPQPMSVGSYYYYIDSTNKSVKLKKATASNRWTDQTENFIGDYKWSYSDANGNPIYENAPSDNGKIIYIDGSMINKKIVITVSVNI